MHRIVKNSDIAVILYGMLYRTLRLVKKTGKVYETLIMIKSIDLQSLIDVMKLMAAAERLVGDFYRHCAEKWEEDRTFWLDIAGREAGAYRLTSRSCSASTSILPAEASFIRIAPIT